MMDRSKTPISVTSARIGRTDLGGGSLVIDDDALTVILESTAEERPIRIALGSVERVTLSPDGGELSLTLREGTRLALISSSPSEVRDELLARCRALPELTRTLRAFGSRRGHRSTRDAAAVDQQRFFAPLLDARRAAGATSAPLNAVAAFAAPRLVRAFETAFHAFASERYGENGPARRALEAELIDLSEPLFLALHALGDAAEKATGSTDDLRPWRTWAAQLRVTFEVADRVWLSLDAALDAAPWQP